MPVDQNVDQSQEDALIKQYGGTVQGGPPAATTQPATTQPATPAEEDIVNQYGGKMVEPYTTRDGMPVYSIDVYGKTPGVPLYQTAPGAPAEPQAPPEDLGRYGGDAAFGRQIQSGYYGALAGVDRLGANVAHLLDAASTSGQDTGEQVRSSGHPELGGNILHLFDTAVSKIAGLTGIDKGGIFKRMEDWAREQQQYRQEQAAQYAGGNEDLPSKVVRGATSAVVSLPITAAATALGGPVGGMAGLGALETADQGPGNMLKGAVEGAAMGKFLHVMGPYGRLIRIPAVAGVEFAKNIAQGVDPETALANALNMGALSATGGPGTKSVLPESLPPGLRVKNTMTPVQQQAVEYLRDDAGVPLTTFQQTGNRFVGALEQTTAHTPLGSQRARQFQAGTQQAMVKQAEKLAGEVHPEPVSPYEGGKAAGGILDQHVAELAGQANDAYKTAWQHAGEPEFTKNVIVKTRTEPVLDDAGKPTGKTQLAPVYKDVNMPVDVRFMKALAADQVDKYEYMPAARRAQSAAYAVLKKISKGDNFITAQQAEEALSGLKEEAGYGTDPNLRDVAQGTAAQMIPRLQAAIDSAVAETGQDSVAGLQNGRKLHAEKMQIADISKKLREEPVEAFRQLTKTQDSGVDFLKEIAKRAPGALPKIGRSYLDNLFDQATSEGGWMRADGVFRQWDKLGDQTKALLFPEASQRQALDRFFLASKITAERINTSGTALVKEAQDAGINIFKWLKGKVAGDLLFSPRGIQFLTGIAQNPPTSASESAAMQAAAAKVFGALDKSPKPTGGGAAPAAGGSAPSMGKGPDQALAYAQEQIASGKDVKLQDLQRRFRLGYGAAQKVLQDAARAKRGGPPPPPPAAGAQAPPGM